MQAVQGWISWVSTASLILLSFLGLLLSIFNPVKSAPLQAIEQWLTNSHDTGTSTNSYFSDSSAPSPKHGQIKQRVWLLLNKDVFHLPGRLLGPQLSGESGVTDDASILTQETNQCQRRLETPNDPLLWEHTKWKQGLLKMAIESEKLKKRKRNSQVLVGGSQEEEKYFFIFLWGFYEAIA